MLHELRKKIKISSSPLNLNEVIRFIRADENGAEDYFIGTVRNATKGESVTHLFFESYEAMAIKEMGKIADRALEQFDINNIAIYHRVGELKIQEVPVIIGVGSAHRDAAFDACKFAIDTLKETVPIWKKEFLENGEVWVSAHP